MRRLRGDESGSALPLVVFALPVLLAVGAFAVDLSSAYVIDGRLQNAADAGALAAVLDIDKSAATVKSTAASVAQRNAASGDGTIATSADVALGFYDAAAKTFTESGTPVNAVRVRAYRTQARGTNSEPSWPGLSAKPISTSPPRRSPWCERRLDASLPSRPPFPRLSRAMAAERFGCRTAGFR